MPDIARGIRPRRSVGRQILRHPRRFGSALPRHRAAAAPTEGASNRPPIRTSPHACPLPGRLAAAHLPAPIGLCPPRRGTGPGGRPYRTRSRRQTRRVEAVGPDRAGHTARPRPLADRPRRAHRSPPTPRRPPAPGTPLALDPSPTACSGRASPESSRWRKIGPDCQPSRCPAADCQTLRAWKRITRTSEGARSAPSRQRPRRRRRSRTRGAARSRRGGKRRMGVEIVAAARVIR